jgi:hypothetical protein
MVNTEFSSIDWWDMLVILLCIFSLALFMVAMIQKHGGNYFMQ